MNKQSRPINSIEYEKPLYVNPNTRVLARLAGNTDTRENNSGIKKVRTYQIFITATNPDRSINTVGRESRKKNLGTTRTKTTRRNAVIPKLKITNKMISTRRKRRKNNMQTTSQKT